MQCCRRVQCSRLAKSHTSRVSLSHLQSTRAFLSAKLLSHTVFSFTSFSTFSLHGDGISGLDMHEMFWRLGLHPGSVVGSYSTSPDPCLDFFWGGGVAGEVKGMGRR